MSQSIRISQSIRDVMTPNPCAISPNASVLDAAQIMRGNDIGEGGDAETTPVGEICSRDLTTIEPTASVADAVRLMRAKAIRRLPVVDDEGFVMGIVSIGDVAVERDRRSALGDISAAPPNA